MIEHLLIKQSVKRSYKNFIEIDNFMDVQKSKLLSILNANKDTKVGKKYGFRDIRSISEFINNVPIGDYETHENWILDQFNTGEHIHLQDKILLYEKSSGSTSPSKFIPYTAALKSEFMNGVEAWLYDLYENFPEIKKGTHYWSISPIVESEKYSPMGVPIGFEEESGYFNALQGRLLSKVFAVPNSVKHSSPEDFIFLTLYHLLNKENLSFISIWNPSFLTRLLDSLHDLKTELIDALSIGHTKQNNNFNFKINGYTKKRAELLKNFDGVNYSILWPKLRLISCWNDGFSKDLADELNEYFPNVEFQGKGLLATEGIISFPLVGIGKVVAYNSHFFEFYNIKTGRVHFLDDLEAGSIYSVIMTTSGGLYRYRIYDLIEVTGHYKGLPIIDFVGKEGHISDYYGEKLNEIHVGNMIKRLGFEGFAVLAPVGEDPISYCLFLENKPDNPEEIESKADSILRENFHYSYARDLGQIEKIRIFKIESNPWETYYKHRSKKVKLGDIKFSPLYKEKGLEVVFNGYFI